MHNCAILCRSAQQEICAEFCPFVLSIRPGQTEPPKTAMTFSLLKSRQKPSQPEAVAPAGVDKLRTFTADFFAAYGATVRPISSATGDTLLVSLPPALAEHFGREQMHLAFQNAEQSSQTQLVAYGSRVFDQIMAFLEKQSALAVLQLPARHSKADDLLHTLQPRNAAVTGLKLEEKQTPLYVFNWHITYRSDDKHEEIFTTVIDENQRLIPIRETDPQPGEEGKLDLSAAFADGEPVAPELDENGQPLPLKLPPMTQLQRLAEAGRKYALYHADVHCVEQEKEILPRLHKVLSRLTTYYEQQIEEVYDAHDPSGEKRQALEEDLQRKIAEEVENHRLRVQLRLNSYAVLYLPVTLAHMTVRNAAQEATVSVVRNRYSGALRRPRCAVCREEIHDLLLDRNGHITCGSCVAECQGCHELLCESCGLHKCPACDNHNCDECSQTCWSCGERACDAHAATCPTCGDTACHACLTACALCGQAQCRSHLRMDSVDGELICGRCAVRCPGCSQLSGHLDTCSASGQRFCTNCLQTCHTCGKSVGPGFFVTDPTTQLPYCHDCLEPCPTCKSLVAAAEKSGCVECEQPVCSHCGLACHACGHRLCQSHAQPCDECRGVFCDAHMTVCAIGHERQCTNCNATCVLCERPHCQEHREQCEVCLQSYCSECIRRSGLCDTCAEMSKRGVACIISEEPVAADPRVANLGHKYRWMRHANSRYTLYLGNNSWGRQVLVVAEGERILHVRRSTIFSRLLGLDFH